jgi:hypothetical protein
MQIRASNSVFLKTTACLEAPVKKWTAKIGKLKKKQVICTQITLNSPCNLFTTLNPTMKQTILLLLCALLPLAGSHAQRFLIEYTNENSKKLFDKAERAYVKQNYKRSADLYADLIAAEGESKELLYNQLTALIHTTDTAAIEKVSTRLMQLPFLDCNFLSLGSDFKAIKYRVVFSLWQKALRACSEKEKAYLDSAKVQMPDIRTQLLWMKFKDIESDVKVSHKIDYGGSPEISFDSLKNLRADTYKDNFEQLLVFVQRIGWPTIAQVGHDGSEAAALIALHANHLPVEQARMLPKLMEAVLAGQAELKHYAYLFDQVCAHYRRPQRYGTLRWKNPDTQLWEIYPIEDPENVDILRKEAGLPPLVK